MKDNLLTKKILQQRQILSIMNLDSWVSKSSRTMLVSDLQKKLETFDNQTKKTSDAIVNVEESSQSNQKTDIFEQSLNTINPEISNNSQISGLDHNSFEKATKVGGFSVESELAAKNATESVNNFQNISLDVTESPKSQDFETASNNVLIPEDEGLPHSFNPFNSVNNDQANTLANLSQLDEIKIAPFVIQAVYFNNWILIVDSELYSDKSLSNPELPELVQLRREKEWKLWQNMLVGLLGQKVTPDSLSFPIVDGMDSLEIAKASLSGFVFKLAKTEGVKIGLLTPFEKNIDDARIKLIPILSEMIEEPKLKSRLWHLLKN